MHFFVNYPPGPTTDYKQGRPLRYTRPQVVAYRVGITGHKCEVYPNLQVLLLQVE